MRRGMRIVLTVAIALAVTAFTPSATESPVPSAANVLTPLANPQPVAITTAPGAVGAAAKAVPAPSSAPVLGITSARIEDRVIPDRATPIGLQIGALDVAAPVIRVGGADDGSMEVPDGIDEVAWYEFGPAPGEAGSAVLAAHVDMAGLGPGVFFDLHSLAAGDMVTVAFDDGTAQAFEVFESRRYLKAELDTGRIFSRTGPATITLVTCGGGFNPALGRYDSNVVVYAAPATARSAP